MEGAMLRSIVMVLWTCVAAASAMADWPSRPVTLLVAFPAGGSDDLLARVVAPRLAQLLGQPVVVQNTSGQGGVTGGLQIAQAAPDGYRIMLGTSATHALSQALYAKPAYDALADFTPVGLIAEQPFAVIARRELEASTLSDLVALAARQPGSLRYTSAGPGSATHLVCELINARIGIKAQHVPRNGGVAALKDVVAGTVDYFCPVITIAIPEVHANNVKALAILGDERSPALPATSTPREQGFDGATANTWFAVFAPAGTPEAVVAKLHAALGEAIYTPAIRDEQRRIGARPFEPERRTPGHLAAFLRQDIQKWRAALAAAQITAR
jgi:tripartite-type tricarboxylate transporter receptor subunit TctC